MSVEPVHFRRFFDLPHPTITSSGKRNVVFVTLTRSYVTCQTCLKYIQERGTH